MWKHLEFGECSLQKLRKLDFQEFCQTWDVSNKTFQAQVNYFLDTHTKKVIFKTKTFSWKVSKHCFCQIRSYARGRTEYLWHICWNWRNCVSGMVREEECSNLSLLSGVRKHTEEVMKNSPKQEESDLVSLPWGLLSSLREGEGKEGKARKKNERSKTGGFGFFSFPICEGFCRDIKIKKREIGSKRLCRFTGSRK